MFMNMFLSIAKKVSGFAWATLAARTRHKTRLQIQNNSQSAQPGTLAYPHPGTDPLGKMQTYAEASKDDKQRSQSGGGLTQQK